MTKSTKTDTQAVQILGAALALGMSLGMLPNTAASAEEMKNQQTLKLQGGPTMNSQKTDKWPSGPTMNSQKTDKWPSGPTMKMNNQNTSKHQN
jgi:hypothetical protein